MKVYVASSWRNPVQPEVVELLRKHDHEVYDFRNPVPDYTFRWMEIDPNYKRWSPERFVDALQHPIADRGFSLDWEAMEQADACVLALPCNRSAHLEAGYFVGAKKPLLILLDHGGHSYSDRPCSACGDLDGCHGGIEPELMYKMATCVCVSASELLSRLEQLEEDLPAIRGSVLPDGQPWPV